MTLTTTRPLSGIKAEQLAMAYAANRSNLSAVNKLIKATLWPLTETGLLLHDHDLLERMEQIRKDWLDDGGEYGQWVAWSCWVDAVNAQDSAGEEELALARLWDRKKEIIREGGKIRTAIACHGRALIKASAKP